MNIISNMAEMSQMIDATFQNFYEDLKISF